MRAAGGAGTENPVGLGVDPKSSLRELPNLQPPGTQGRAFGERVATSGFGPIAAGWPDRGAR